MLLAVQRDLRLQRHDGSFNRLFGVSRHFASRIAAELAGRIEDAVINAPEISTPAYNALLDARAAWRSMDMQAALKHALSSIELNANNTQAHAFAAQAYYQSSSHDEDAFERAFHHNALALEIHPHNRTAMFQKAWYDHHLHRSDARRFDELANLATRYPNDRNAWFLMQAYLRGGRASDAGVVAAHMHSLSPRDVTPLTILAMTQYQTGDAQSAQITLKIARDIAPDNASLPYHEFLLAAAMRRFDDASMFMAENVAVLEKLAAPKPARDIVELEMRGRMMAAQGQLDQARNAADKLRSLDRSRCGAPGTLGLDQWAANVNEIYRQAERCGVLAHHPVDYIRPDDPAILAITEDPRFPDWAARHLTEKVNWRPATAVLQLND